MHTKCSTGRQPAPVLSQITITSSADSFDPVKCTFDGYRIFPPRAHRPPPQVPGTANAEHRTLTLNDMLAELQASEPVGDHHPARQTISEPGTAGWAPSSSTVVAEPASTTEPELAHWPDDASDAPDFGQPNIDTRRDISMDDLYAEMGTLRQRAEARVADATARHARSQRAQGQEPKLTADEPSPPPLPDWFDKANPDVIRVLPDLQVLHLIDFYISSDLADDVFGRQGLRPSMLCKGLAPHDEAIQSVATFFCSTVGKYRMAKPTADDLEAWLRERGADDEACRASREALHVIRHGVKAKIGDLDDLVESILARENAPVSANSPQDGRGSADEDKAESPLRRRRNNKMADEHADHFCEVPAARVSRWARLPILYDGTEESLIDTLVMNALLIGKLDLADIAKKALYFTVTRNVSELAKRARKRSATVRQSLARLELQHRIYMPIPPRRGRNGTTIHIGVHSSVLFAPVLTPQRLWNLSVERYLKAVKAGDGATARQEADRLARHLDRIPDDDAERPKLRAIVDEIQQNLGVAKA